MVKFDVSILRYLKREHFRMLTAVEMGMKNHELVPEPLIASIACLKHGGIGRLLQELTKHRLLAYEAGKRYSGYRLTYLGYDYLALKVLTRRGSIATMGNKIGVGKESDVFVGAGSESSNYEKMAVKVHRLGRTCFRKVTEKRDYKKRPTKSNWLYLSRLAALREYSFMQALHDRKFPVPKPVDANRHVVLMELIDGTLLNNLLFDDIQDVAKLYRRLMEILFSLAADLGLVHGDFNEFNIMVKNQNEEPILIDFPQMVATNHQYAQGYFNRDVKCVVDFFAKRFSYVDDFVPSWEDVHIDEPKLEEAEAILKSVNERTQNSDTDEHDDHDDDDDTNQDDIQEEELGSHTESSQSVANKMLVSQFVQSIQLDHDLSEDVPDVNVLTEPGLEATKFKGSSTTTHNMNDAAHYSPSIACSTIAPEDIRARLRKEKTKRDQQQEVKNSIKNKHLKGHNNIMRRRRRDDSATARQDMTDVL